MAVIKPVKTPHGVVATYHKIIKVEFSVVDSVMTVVTAIYATEEARDEGSEPLWHEYIRVPFEHMTPDPRVGFYQLVSTYFGSYLEGAIRDERADPVPEVPTPVDSGPQVDEAPVPLESGNG